MSFKILITGPPRCGKSTLIRKLINNLQNDYTLHGFLTPEVKEKGKRIGFDIRDVNSGKTVPLARKGNYSSDFTLGSYKVFIDEFNHYLNESMLKIIENERVDDQNNSFVLIIDEIGKMELFSELFQSTLKKVFTSDVAVIATVGKHMNHPIKDFILNKPEVKLFSLTRQNQKEVMQNILEIINRA
jgi:nucleoside-triphosphatase